MWKYNVCLKASAFHSSKLITKLSEYVVSIPLFRSTHRRCSDKKRCSWKLRKIHKKTPVPESILIKLHTFFTEHVWATASAHYKAQIFDYIEWRMQASMISPTTIVKMCRISCWNVIMTGSIRGHLFYHELLTHLNFRCSSFGKTFLLCLCIKDVKFGMVL